MKRRNKFIASIAALVMMGQVATYAEMPQWSFTVDGKAYSLDAQFDEKLGTEIKEVFANGSKNVFVKKDGKWFTNENKIASSKAVGSVVYKNEEGKYVSYDAKDGQVIEFGVKEANFIATNKVEINYTTVGNAESMLNKANYKIGGVALGEKDTVELSKDGKSVVITLAAPLKVDNIATSIEVGSVKDLNQKELTSVKSEVLVINSNSGLDKLGAVKSNVNVLVDGVTIKGATIEGNLHISGKGVKVEGSKVSGAVALDVNTAKAKAASGQKAPAGNTTDGDVYIINTTAKSIDIDNTGNQKVSLNGVKAENLNVSGTATIEAGAGTSIKSTLVEASLSLIGKGGALGAVTIEFAPEVENKDLSLSGNFKGSNFTVTFDANITTTPGTTGVKVAIDTETAVDPITLTGRFEELKLENKADVTIGENSKVDKVIVDKDASGVEIKTEEGAKIGQVVGEGNVTGDGTVEPEKPSTGDDNGYVPPVISKTEQDKLIEKMVDTYKTLETVKGYATVAYNYETNKVEVTIADAYKEKTLGDLYATAIDKEAAKRDMQKILNMGLQSQVRVTIDGKQYKAGDLAVEVLGTKDPNAILAMTKDQITEKVREFYWANRNENIKVELYEDIEDGAKVVNTINNIKFNNQVLFDGTKVAAHDTLLGAFGMKSGEDKYNTPIKNFFGTYTIVTTGESTPITIVVK